LGSGFYGNLGLRGASQTSDQAAQLWGNVAGVFCNRTPQDIPGENARQFDGGQCDSVLYNLTYDIDVFNPNSGQTSPLNVVSGWYGPLGAVRVTDGGNGTELTARTGPGQPVTTVQDQTYGVGFVVSNIRNVSVSRADGQPDNCGNMPGTIPEYDPDNFNYPTTIDFDDDGGTPVSLPVGIVYAPIQIAPDLSVRAPFTVNINNAAPLVGQINLSTGDINIGVGNGAGDGVTTEPVELEPGEEPEGDVVVVGVRLSSVVVNQRKANINEIGFESASVSAWFPRLGRVYFLYDDELGQSLANAKEYNLLEQSVLTDRPAKAVEVFARDGVTTTWRLLVRPKPTGECCS